MKKIMDLIKIKNNLKHNKIIINNLIRLKKNIKINFASI
jgi:hypothetical protein